METSTIIHELETVREALRKIPDLLDQAFLTVCEDYMRTCTREGPFRHEYVSSSPLKSLRDSKSLQPFGSQAQSRRRGQPRLRKHKKHSTTDAPVVNPNVLKDSLSEHGSMSARRSPFGSAERDLDLDFGEDDDDMPPLTLADRLQMIKRTSPQESGNVFGSVDALDDISELDDDSHLGPTVSPLDAHHALMDMKYLEFEHKQFLRGWIWAQHNHVTSENPFIGDGHS
eukprot:Clim_evm65s108 gene=Clim_evmTU65s108